MDRLRDNSASRQRTDRSRAVLARARANIALAKYWGRTDATLHLPAVPSVSLTLDPLITETRVRFEADLKSDTLVLDDRPADESELMRASELLHRVRQLGGLSSYARVESRNNFPTASGLASSASGFAALAAAACSAAGIDPDPYEMSALARASSASAARSVFGGFVCLPAATGGQLGLSARPLAPPDHWDVRIVVAITTEGPKPVASNRGMIVTEQGSPYYDAWVRKAPELAREIEQGVLDRDLERVGTAMEQSTLAMHGCAMASSPGLLYWLPATVAAFRLVRELREQRGIGVWATMDAGPHVKALCLADQAHLVEAELANVPGVLRTIMARPGPGVEIE